MVEAQEPLRAASSSAQTFIPPPAPDYDELTNVIQLYIDGFNHSDIDSFRACFHENAWWACTMPDGSFVQYPVAESLSTWVGPDYRGCTHRIISVIQAGDVATVILEMHSVADPSSAWVDIHSLLRIGDVWKDMNKTATHAVRAAWAGALVGH